MTTFTVRNTTTDPAIQAFSAGEALHADSSSTAVAAVAAFQTDTTDTSTGAAVFAECRGGGPAVYAHQVHATGSGAAVVAECEGAGASVIARQKNAGVKASAVFAECFGQGDTIYAIQRNPSADGAAIYAEHAVGKNAAFFRGNVVVTGDVSFPGADCAEDFTVAAETTGEPGTLMSLSPTGELVPSEEAYDRKVVGVIAGAGSLRSGIILGRQDARDERRRPIALVGTVYCRVDAREEPIEVGDLLTSATTRGHAMRASDSARAFGAVIGKAMAPLRNGLGLIPIIIALQ